jgi:hypothetical protein
MSSPAPVVVCPWCIKPIEPGQDTAKVNNITWHAGCAEDHERAEAEEAGL